MRRIRLGSRLRGYSISNLPIRYKLIVHFLLISIIPSIILGALILLTTNRVIERQVNDNTLQLIDKVNKVLENVMSSMQNITYLVPFNPLVDRFVSMQSSEGRFTEDEQYELKQFLQGFTTLHSEIAGIMVVNRNGEYVSNEMYTRTAKNLTKEAWYQEAVESKGVFRIVGHPEARNVTSHVPYKEDEIISVVRSVLDPDTQQVKGVILIDVKLRVIAETVKDVRLGRSGYLMVIDEDGQTIYNPTHAVIEQMPQEWFADTDHSGTFSKEIDGNRLQFIYLKSSFTGWNTIGVFSSRESVYEARELSFYVISFVYVVCLLGIAASFMLSYNISKPIHKLMLLMKQAESGDLTKRYRGRSKDEVGMLGGSFNTMINQINKLLSLTKLQERQKRETELRSLQAHIKPHFLYNTLDTIQWMARRRNAEDVAEVVESLSKLFRIGLSRGKDMIPFEEELEHIRSYLMIQKTRYRDKLNYNLDIAPGMGQFYVMKLILQPIVENAIYHGIKERKGAGQITIQAWANDGRLMIRISDNGKGMTAETLARVREQLSESISEKAKNYTEGKKSYGIVNVQERIKLTFGETYGISIQSEWDQGTTVTIEHPVITRPYEQEKG
ncbi:sensor histidine kinase [Marinicrinis lubricantis]|uniref:Sensor histidine kinase n=1 Tax=Marinicrinis lubricantis TaxID=2086470 RepID=A0ABW1IJ59_9BACL